MTENAATLVNPQRFLPPGKKVVRVVFNQIIKLLTNIICKVDADQLNKVPLVGPLIVISNHVNFLELPMIYPRVPSDLGIGFSKEENWKIWFYRILFSVWDVIPINREEVDLTALRRGIEALEKGRILFIAPEGTRSHDGYLQVGKPGVVMLAQRTSAWVVPVACYGGEKFAENIKRLRRTEYHIAVGEPFRIETNDVKVTRAVRQQITDEMMYQIAALLPPEYRGVYANLDNATQTYLRFDRPGANNLQR